MLFVRSCVVLLASHSLLSWAEESRDVSPPSLDFLAIDAETVFQNSTVDSPAVISPPPPSTQPPAPKPPAEPKNFYVEPRSNGTRRDTEPPRYVRNLSEIDWLNSPEETWLDLGLEQRWRYEYRQNDFRRPFQELDEPLLLRTRAYIGVKEILDPFRFGAEFQDSRRYNSDFPVDNRDVNQGDLIQAFGELYFADALGDDRPVRVQYGRLAFEYLDRRLIARNEWRNTTNNFQGLRAIFGQQTNDWQLDLLALQPIERLPYQFDRVDEERLFMGAIGDWRRWSEIVTLQPYWLTLYDYGNTRRLSRTVYTLGLRSYGIVGDTGYDYDVDLAFQTGRTGDKELQAFGFTTELGYTYDKPWKPRLSGFVGYASGDRDPNDGKDQHFDRLFGFARPWSADDYFTWENLLAPKVRLDLQPHKKFRVDMGYGVFWLASDRDSWPNAGLRDPTGQSGNFVGHELDIRFRITATDRTDLTLGYAHFIPGEFPSSFGKDQDSDFFYIEVSPRLFK